MKTFLLFSLFDLIFLTNESPDYFRPNSFLNAHLDPLPTERTQREYSGIRIKLFFDKSIPNYSVYRNWTKEAIDFFSSSLKVKPVNSRIFIERNCDSSMMYSYFDSTSGKYESYCSGRCSIVTYCIHVPVPEDHLNQCKHCSNNQASSCRIEQNKGSGVKNADLVLYIGSLRTDQCHYGNVAAYASWCAKEGTLDRPIAGAINICPSTMQVGLRAKRLFVETIIHEVMHVLGFSKSLYGYFRDQNGNPLTKRDEIGQPIGQQKKLGFNVSDQVIRFAQRDWHVRGNKHLKKSAALIVTQKVLQEVRAHFNCPTLEGAELEDSQESYSHWEARVFHGEVMEAANEINMLNVFSRINFALLEDTGWYQVNYSYAEPLEFGKNLGCDFCTRSCKYWMDTRSDPSPYCNTNKGFYCTFDRKAVGTCTLVQYVVELDPLYQYFEDIKDVHKHKTGFYGGKANADYCPIIGRFTWLDRGKGSECIQESNIPNIDKNTLLESYGKNSLCFESKTDWVVVQFPGTCRRGSTTYKVLQKVGCYKYSCEDGWLHIHVQERKYTCFHKGQIIEVQILEPITKLLHKGTIICPSCKDICKNARCNPDNWYQPQQYKHKKDQCIENVVNRPTIKPALKPTHTTEWIPFWVTNAYSPPTQERSTPSTRRTWPTQSTRRTWTTQRSTKKSTTSSTTASIIVKSTSQASETITEKTEKTIGTKWTKESTDSSEVQTKRTMANDSTKAKPLTDSKPAVSWTALTIIILIALLLILSAITYFLFTRKKAEKIKTNKERRQSERKSKTRMTKG